MPFSMLGLGDIVIPVRPLYLSIFIYLSISISVYLYLYIYVQLLFTKALGVTPMPYPCSNWATLSSRCAYYIISIYSYLAIYIHTQITIYIYIG